MRFFLCAAALAGLFIVSPALAGECLVDDPTGTPLNVRAEPNGQIFTTLQNGTGVAVLEERRLGTKHWLLVSVQGRQLGWIFAAYVVCPATSDAVKAAPGLPATQR
jgi:hypothetical protein